MFWLEVISWGNPNNTGCGAPSNARSIMLQTGGVRTWDAVWSCSCVFACSNIWSSITMVESVVPIIKLVEKMSFWWAWSTWEVMTGLCCCDFWLSNGEESTWWWSTGSDGWMGYNFPDVWWNNSKFIEPSLYGMDWYFTAGVARCDVAGKDDPCGCGEWFYEPWWWWYQFGCVLMRNIAWYGMVWSGWQGRSHQHCLDACVKCTSCLVKGVVALPFLPRGWHNEACVIKSLVSPSLLPFPLP